MLTVLIIGLYHPLTHGKPSQELHVVYLITSSYMYIVCLPLGQITISSLPHPLLVRIGASFSLSCNYNSYTFHSWVHPALGEVTSSQGRIQLTNLGKVHLATLEVNSATTEDQGVYVCQAITGSNNNILNQTISALIFERVQITTESMLTYEARLCETVVLNCTALYHDSIIWSMKAYDQTLTVPNSIDGRITVLSGTGQLVISEAKLSDNGTYGCAASNRVSSKEIIAYLNIIGNVAIKLKMSIHDDQC